MKIMQLLVAITVLGAAASALAASDNDWLVRPTPQTSAPAPGSAAGDVKGDTSNQSAVVP